MASFASVQGMPDYFNIHTCIHMYTYIYDFFCPYTESAVFSMDACFLLLPTSKDWIKHVSYMQLSHCNKLDKMCVCAYGGMCVCVHCVCMCVCVCVYWREGQGERGGGSQREGELYTCDRLHTVSLVGQDQQEIIAMCVQLTYSVHCVYITI